MHRHLGVVSIAILLATATQGAIAQTCLGRPFFSTGHIQLGAGFQVGNHSTLIGGDIAVGKDQSFFVQGTVGRESIDFAGINDPDGLVFGAAAGYQISSGRKQVCPYASARVGSFDLPGSADLKRSQVQLGVMMGVAPRAGSGLHFVPFGGLSVAQLSTDIEDEGDFDFSFGTDTYFPLTLGLGVHFSRKVALIGDITIPIDLGNGDPSLGIRAVFPLGGRN